MAKHTKKAAAIINKIQSKVRRTKRAEAPTDKTDIIKIALKGRLQQPAFYWRRLRLFESAVFLRFAKEHPDPDQHHHACNQIKQVAVMEYLHIPPACNRTENASEAECNSAHQVPGREKAFWKQVGHKTDAE